MFKLVQRKILKYKLAKKRRRIQRTRKEYDKYKKSIETFRDKYSKKLLEFYIVRASCTVLTIKNIMSVTIPLFMSALSLAISINKRISNKTPFLIEVILFTLMSLMYLFVHFKSSYKLKIMEKAYESMDE